MVITLDKMGIIRPESEGQAALGSDAQQAAARANADRGEAERGDAPRDTDAGDGSARPLSE